MELRRSWQGIERELRRNGEGIEQEMIWNGKGTDLELNRLGRVQGDSRWNCNGIAMELPWNCIKSFCAGPAVKRSALKRLQKCLDDIYPGGRINL